MNAVVRLLAILCIAVLAFGAATGTGAAQASGGQLVVELETNGDADAVFTDGFDLTDGDDRELFEEVQASAELRDAAAGQFGEEMQFVSDAASEGIDREIGVEAVTVETAVDGETGIVAYRFRWVNLAAVDDGNVTLSEPFSTYDSLDRELVVFAPEGYELTSVSPQPERQGTDVATWPGLTEFGEGTSRSSRPLPGRRTTERGSTRSNTSRRTPTCTAARRSHSASPCCFSGSCSSAGSGS